ncbi:hypothetical protein JTE90_008304 [Oedothorax gibbosus]|uniref:cGMP-dependent protein kinase interacting domain-containing protein n=1 Tax=Oedothorax gibbosus TaxID=931172 RepID=A0AAV6UH62_9ARAC|nr:hypothetical protein JTE90_008304 [Oedothorax gibbosus]
MPIETRWNSSFLRRAEQLKRWEQSDTNNIPPKDKKTKIRFSDGCVFLDACASNDIEETERLLATGTYINTSNVDGLTALHQACINNNLEMVEFLVNHQCDVDCKDNDGWTPLHSIAANGFLSIAKFLIEHGANAAAVNCDGHLPIDVSESLEMGEYLSGVLDEKGIDVDEARSEEERIMMADAEKMLAGDSINVDDTVHPLTGATALHVAASKGYCKVMEVLVQANVYLNAQDNDGWTPLHAAAHWSQRSACKILAENLANMDIKNLAGQTCFDVADVGMIAFLGDLQMKQVSIQKAHPEILQRTNTRSQLRKQTAEILYHGEENSKSKMKVTKTENTNIEMILPGKENVKKKILNERVFFVNKSPAKPSILKSLVNPLLLQRTPSWKEVAGCTSEEKEKHGMKAKTMFKKAAKFKDKLKEKEDDVVRKNKRPCIPEDDFKENNGNSSQSRKQIESSDVGRSPSSLVPENELFLGVVLPPRNANKPSIGTQASGHSNCSRHKSGFSVSIADSASNNSWQEEVHASEGEKKGYIKLYEETMNENEKLKEAVRKKQEELKDTKKALKRLFESNVLKISASETVVRSLKRKNSASEAERKLLELKNSSCEAERKCLARKISELEDKLKQMENFKADNHRLKEEVAVLIRVISKISL